MIRVYTSNLDGDDAVRVCRMRSFPLGGRKDVLQKLMTACEPCVWAFVLSSEHDVLEFGVMC